MADTGDEHDRTYEHVKFVEQFCKSHSIDFYFITSDMGFHPKSWPDLISWMKRNSGIMSKVYPKTCTDNLKIKPIYNFLDAYIGQFYYPEIVKEEFPQHWVEPQDRSGSLPFSKYNILSIPARLSCKRFIKQFAKDHGRIRVIIGIAKGEETRLGSHFPHKWMADSLERVYPLVEIGVDRQACQDSIKAFGLPLPPPSNCKRCPFMDKIELLWMYRFDRKAFDEWVIMEQRKVDKSALMGVGVDRNFGVNGKKLLPKVIEEAVALYGHMTDDELQEYKMSHGHCVKSRY
ncbi:MAG TPA: hypothetical protein VEA58_11435 [Anaerovoracaceae bacterium]|nr:hypothetical protein [Anaerovoracaceae bacterium]